jgi:alpha-1,3-rhamnosyl/mannosyltransferase
VVTVHDAIAERFPHLTLPSARARLFWRLKVGLALRQARLVLTVSDYSARDLQRVLGVAAERIRIAVEAPAAAYRPATREEIAAAAARLGLPEGASWFVYVGGFNPHKNVDAIVRAHAAVRAGRNGSAPWLLLVGTLSSDVFHGDQGRIRAAIAAAGTEGAVRWTGWLPDEELRPLLAGAAALVLPSECEGFGLPAVEAAACGAAVIATVESPLPELLDGGGIWVRPRDQGALEAAMRTVLDDPARRAALGGAALARARAMSWSSAARVALGALREASS